MLIYCRAILVCTIKKSQHYVFFLWYILPRWSRAQFGNSLLGQEETSIAVTSSFKSRAL